MNIYMSGSMVHVGGDWTLTGITQLAVESLVFALQQIELGNTRKLLIDCRDVFAIDSTGLQLLSAWLQCASLRGVEPELLNPPNKLFNIFQRFGFPCYYSFQKRSRHNRTDAKHWRRRFHHEYQRDKDNCHATSY